MLELVLETGRTHQIRAHMAHIGHPLAGDDMYGGHLDIFERQCLHCSQAELEDPYSGEKIVINCPAKEFWDKFNNLA